MHSETLVYDQKIRLSESKHSPVALETSPACKFDVLGVGVSALNLMDSVKLIDAFLLQGCKGYVSVTGVHGVMEANRDETFRTVLNSSLLVVPDGMPLVWLGRIRGFRHVGRVYGPDLMLRVCELSVVKGYTHFLCGGAPGIADELKASLMKQFPGLKIVGTYSPPYRGLNIEEQRALAETIHECAPDITWVGISTPKQERFMSTYIQQFHTKLMFGVGAAFDIHTGHLRDAPNWMKKAGLQWLHRLWQEPRRLWQRYTVNIPLFLLHSCLQFLGKRYS